MEKLCNMSSKSTSRTNCSKSSSSRLKRDARVVSQTPIDAKLHVDFEESERLFDYSTSIDVNASISTSNVPSSTVSAYLQKMQRGNQIQPFGCMIAIDDQTLSVLAYSENTLKMLDLAPQAIPSIEQQEALTFETDVRTLFRSSSAATLQKATNFPEVKLLIPILVHCRNLGKPFYAILHRNDVGLIIDLEPVNPSDVPVIAAGELKSYKLASKAISRLQSLQSGNISLMCDALVREIYGAKEVQKGRLEKYFTKFAVTRTPTQVASHAQKYFIRQLCHTCIQDITKRRIEQIIDIK